MKAVGYLKALDIDNPSSLLDLDVPAPKLERTHDLLVRVEAISVNPVDTKVRRHRTPSDNRPEILGWDAVGEVVAIGDAVRGFQPGQRVFYAGAIDRSGCNSELHLVDARLAALAPSKLSAAEAAALPLTTLTAWELLFERLGLAPDGGAAQSLLVVGAAGGVGSMLVQLARQLTRLTVIGTASRPQSSEWITRMGAHAVIDHMRPFGPQLKALGIDGVTAVASLTHTPQHLDDIVDVLVPRGRLALIDDFPTLDIMKLKSKSLSLHWELMFTRSLYQTEDMQRHGDILAEVARLSDAGVVHSTLGSALGTINAAQMRQAHALIESGRAIGKVVLQGFSEAR